MFHFWFNTFFVQEHLASESNNEELPVERSTKTLSCDGTAMELPMMTQHINQGTGSLANLGSVQPTLVLSIDKWGLDDAHKDKHHKLYNENFKVSNYFQITRFCFFRN